VIGALAVALDALFADVTRRADGITGFGEVRLRSETTRIDLRVAEGPQPRPGDRIKIDAGRLPHPGRANPQSREACPDGGPARGKLAVANSPGRTSWLSSRPALPFRLGAGFRLV
jgi:hypothetical protein